jgi:hypothetical protein
MRATSHELGIAYRGKHQDRFACPKCERENVLSVDFDKGVFRCFRPTCELYNGGKLVDGADDVGWRPQGAAIGQTADAKRAAAQRIWDESLSIFAGDDRAEYARAGYLYLRGRGIENPESGALRQHPGLWCQEMVERGLTEQHGTTPRQPALVAKVTDAQGDFLGVQRIWLGRDDDGIGVVKAPLQAPKKTLGPIAGGVVRIDEVLPEHDAIAIAEGIETALAVSELAREMFGGRDVPVWSAVSAGNMPSIAACVPRHVDHVFICADNDRAGLLAAHQLAERLQASRQDLRVTIRRPRKTGSDYSNELTDRRTRRNMEMLNVGNYVETERPRTR